jgi:predicted small lipoprotein YifL
MKQVFLALSLVLLVAGVLTGCGKSDEMKKVEAALNAEVMDKHEAVMKLVPEMDQVTSHISAVMARHDSLVKKYPALTAGHTTADLVAAQEKIAAAKAAMDAWMRSFKPYDPEAKHDAVIAGLNVQKDELTSIEKQFVDARRAAFDALAKHEVAADVVIAKAAQKKH